jgi:hypothetical protein
LGLIRICCGLTALYVHLAYTFDLDALIGPHAWLDTAAVTEYRRDSPIQSTTFTWSELVPDVRPLTAEEEAYSRRWGVDPRLLYARGIRCWSIWFHIQDPSTIAVVHGGILVIFVLFTAGVATRVTSVLAWAAALSYIHRSPATVFGMDAVMSSLMLYLMIGPSGSALSVDRLIEGWRRRRRGEVLPPPPPSSGANFAIRLMQIHFCIIYAASGFAKLQGGAWWNGTAMWGVMANPEFNPVHVWWYRDLLTFLCQHRWLWEIVTSGGVVFTLSLEIGFPFLVWSSRWRPWMILGAVLLHLGIAMTMGLMTFGLMMLSMLLSFIPPEAVRGLLEGIWAGGQNWAAGTKPTVQRGAAA